MSDPATYLSVCAIYRDEAPYLREWIEFHRLVGAERFFLYDNNSADDHRDELAPYLRDGTVELHEWPQTPGQLEAYDHCLEHHGEESRWIAFLDLDEFLFSPRLRPLPELLPRYEQWAAVGVNWALFGNSWHETKPPGLVIENYHWRVADGDRLNKHIKSIVDPRRAIRSRDPHYFEYSGDGFAVDENEKRIRYAITDVPSFDTLRVNHYFSKSDEECRRKLEKGKADQPTPRTAALENYKQVNAERNQVHDETILAYLDPLRDALARVEARA